MDPHADAELARRLATEAGTALVALRDTPAWLAGEPTRRRDAGDAAAQRLIAQELAAARPGDAVLSEEAPDNGDRLDAERVWIVDPLDGTREYAEGRDDWAVHVALWQRGELAAGAVALPARGLTLGTDTSPPPPPPKEAGRPIRLAVSRSRPSNLVRTAARTLGATLVPLGSAGYKVSAVILGEADGYVHSGGQYEWDSAAPVAVARAAGLHASRLDGAPLVYNQPDPYLPDLLVCRPELADTLLSACSPATRSTT